MHVTIEPGRFLREQETAFRVHESRPAVRQCRVGTPPEGVDLAFGLVRRPDVVRINEGDELAGGSAARDG